MILMRIIIHDVMIKYIKIYTQHNSHRETHKKLRRAKDTGYLTFCSECRKMTFWGKGIWWVLKCWMESEATQHLRHTRYSTASRKYMDDSIT